MRIKCFNYKYFFRQSPSPPQEKLREKRFIGSWRKKVPYQGSWRKVFEQTYSQQTYNKEQTGKLENLFSIQNLKISIIGFVIVPVMCILAILNTNGVTMKIFNNFWLKANFPQNNQAWFRPIYRWVSPNWSTSFRVSLSLLRNGGNAIATINFNWYWKIFIKYQITAA